MLQSERHDGLVFVSVPIDQQEAAIATIKSKLNDEDRTCSECDHTAPESRWGLQTHETTNPDRVAIALCCPVCETKADLSVNTDH